jgi:hypothetical protein
MEQATDIVAVVHGVKFAQEMYRRRAESPPPRRPEAEPATADELAVLDVGLSLARRHERITLREIEFAIAWQRLPRVGGKSRRERVVRAIGRLRRAGQWRWAVEADGGGTDACP